MKRPGTRIGRFAAAVLVALLVVMSLPALSLAEEAVALVDVKGHWAEKSIETLVQRGITKGYPGGYFKPQNTITRAEFVTFVLRALGMGTPPAPTGDSFADTGGHWARALVEMAVATGLVVPAEYAGGQFVPDQPIAREEIAAMVVRALAFKQPATQQNWPELTFADAKQISPVRSLFVAAAVGLKFMGGYPDNTFRPQNTATRAEAAAVLIRLLNRVEQTAQDPAQQGTAATGQQGTPAAGQAQSGPGTWQHPAGWLNVSMSADWKIQPVTMREAFPNMNSTTVMTLILKKGENVVTAVFGPAFGVPDNVLIQSIAASYQDLNAAGITEQTVAGQKTYVAEIVGGARKASLVVTRRADLFVHFIIIAAPDAQGDILNTLLAEAAAGITSNLNLNNDPTNGNPALIGSWYARNDSVSQTGGVTTVRESSTTVSFASNGVATVGGYSSYSYSGTNWPSGDLSSQQGGEQSYYRVLGDLLYGYGKTFQVMTIGAHPNGLLLGGQLFTRTQ